MCRGSTHQVAVAVVVVVVVVAVVAVVARVAVVAVVAVVSQGVVLVPILVTGGGQDTGEGRVPMRC